MVINEQTIQNILSDHLFGKDIYQDGKFQCGFDELVEGITVELNLIADTERRLHNIGVEEQMLLEEHQKVMHDIKVSRAEVILQCRHHSTSLNRCDICGTEVDHGS